mmetsp:Transcript_15899/g.35386  ORF Transcript_15899/g.35386 Transcript_15899/m.35386 type:complete len:395 (-) Transcript_15899:163-1347(-)
MDMDLVILLKEIKGTSIKSLLRKDLATRLPTRNNSNARTSRFVDNDSSRLRSRCGGWCGGRCGGWCGSWRGSWCGFTLLLSCQLLLVSRRLLRGCLGLSFLLCRLCCGLLLRCFLLRCLSFRGLFLGLKLCLLFLGSTGIGFSLSGLLARCSFLCLCVSGLLLCSSLCLSISLGRLLLGGLGSSLSLGLSLLFLLGSSFLCACLLSGSLFGGLLLFLRFLGSLGFCPGLLCCLSSGTSIGGVFSSDGLLFNDTLLQVEVVCALLGRNLLLGSLWLARSIRLLLSYLLRGLGFGRCPALGCGFDLWSSCTLHYLTNRRLNGPGGIGISVWRRDEESQGNTGGTKETKSLDGGRFSGGTILHSFDSGQCTSACCSTSGESRLGGDTERIGSRCREG